MDILPQFLFEDIYESISEIISHTVKGMFFQAADLGLGNADLIGHFHLGFSFVEAEINNVSFPFSQPVHGISKRNILHPVFFQVLFITDLIHNI